MTPLRVGILGAGPHVRQTLLPGFRAAGWEVGALCSVDADLPDLAARLAIPVATADYRAVVERDDLDAVAIATPTPDAPRDPARRGAESGDAESEVDQ